MANGFGIGGFHRVSAVIAIANTSIDTNGCMRDDLFIHGVAGSPGAIDADVQSYDLSSGSLLLLSGGTNYASSVQVDEVLQAGHAAGTIMTIDRPTST